MNLIKISSLLVAGILSVSTVGCNNSSNTEVDKPKEQVEQSAKEENKEENKEEKVVDTMLVANDDVEIKITGIELGKDYEGKDVLIVKYNFTNNGEEPTSAMMNAHMQAFQNGKEIETAIMVDGNEYNDQLDIMKGITQEDCWYTFALEDMSEVTLFVKAEWVFGDKVEYTVNLDDMTITRK